MGSHQATTLHRGTQVNTPPEGANGGNDQEEGVLRAQPLLALLHFIELPAGFLGAVSRATDQTGVLLKIGCVLKLTLAGCAERLDGEPSGFRDTDRDAFALYSPWRQVDDPYPLGSLQGEAQLGRNEAQPRGGLKVTAQLEGPGGLITDTKRRGIMQRQQQAALTYLQVGNGLGYRAWQALDTPHISGDFPSGG